MLQQKNKFACLALSGGLDSTSLLLHLLAKDYKVTAISFLYGQKHSVEIDCAKQLIHYLAQKGHHVSHHLIELEGLQNLLFSSLIQDGQEVPEGPYDPQNMLTTVVPNRNKIFISILQSIALSMALREKQAVIVAMGIHAGDHVVYPDCRQEFIDSDYQAYLSGNWNADVVSNYLPFINSDKYGVLRDGFEACSALGIDFDEVYKRTITSYKPNSAGVSDYKSASSISRIDAFIRLNREDPILYADETGIVAWQTVKSHVLQVLARTSAE